MRAGAPNDTDIALALEVLSAAAAPKVPQPLTDEQKDKIGTDNVAPASEVSGGEH